MDLRTALAVEAKKTAYDDALDAALTAAIHEETQAAESESEIRLTPVERFSAIGERVLALATTRETRRHHGEYAGQEHSGKVKLGLNGLAIHIRATQPYARGLLRPGQLEYVAVSWVKETDTESRPFATQGLHLDHIMPHRITSEVYGVLRLMEQTLDVAELARHDTLTAAPVSTT